MAIPPRLEGSGALLALAPLFPYRVSPNDELAIYAVLESLIANEEPPRVDVTRVRGQFGVQEWLTRAPYPNGRLLIRGKCRAGAGDVTGYIVWYCCARFGRTIPVSEWPLTVGEGTPTLYDAPFDEFSCLTNPPYNLNSAGDGWREAYDAAYAALT